MRESLIIRVTHPDSLQDAIDTDGRSMYTKTNTHPHTHTHVHTYTYYFASSNLVSFNHTIEIIAS